MSTFQEKLSLSQNGGVYYENTRLKPSPDPVLVVSLGGTGADALLRIKNQVQTRVLLPRDPKTNEVLADTPENFAFLAIDTDRETEKKGYGVASLDQFGEEFLNITIPNLPQQVQNITENHMDSPVWDWFDRAPCGISGTDGAGGVRQFGRFMVIYNYDHIRNKISAALKKIMPKAASNKLKVYLIAGLAGGTGSGSFLDIAYIIRDIIENENLAPQYQFHGFLTTPDMRLGNDPASPMSNGFAALKELDYWMSIGEHGNRFVQAYTLNHVVNSAKAPFDYCHLISSHASDGSIVSYPQALDVIANSIFAYTVNEQTAGDGNSAMSSMYDNIAEHLNIATKTYPAFYRYLSVGSEWKEIPYTEITTLLAAKVFRHLAPLFAAQPSEASFRWDVKNLQLEDNQILGAIASSCPPSPVNYEKLGYNDIWPNNGPYRKVDQRIAQSQSLAATNAANFPKVHEDLLRRYIQRLFVQDVQNGQYFGPCYAARMISSNTSWNLISWVRAMAAHYRQVISTNLAPNSAKLENQLKSCFSGGQNAGIFQKANFAKEYRETLQAWENATYMLFIYSKGAEALDAFARRLERYNQRVFAPLCNALCLLPGIFEENETRIRSDALNGVRNPRHLITPLEFERDYHHEIESHVLTASAAFINELYGKLPEWVGLELDEIDQDIARRENIPGYIASRISDNFQEVLKLNIVTLLQAQGDQTAPIGDKIRKLYQELQSKAYPLLGRTSLDIGIGVETFGYLSVPHDCPDMQNVYKNNPVARTQLKTSDEVSRVQWINVLAGIPLFAIPEIDTMERYYEQCMGGNDTRRGKHLRWDWRDKLPNPLPEKSWPAALRNSDQKAYSAARNARVRKAFDACRAEGIVELISEGSEAGNGILYLGNGAMLANAAIVGTAAQKMAQAQALKAGLWSKTGAHRILPNLRGTIQDPMESIQENTLRFYNLCEDVLAQAELLNQYNALCAKFTMPKAYVRALAANLIAQAGAELKFRRSEMDALPSTLCNLLEIGDRTFLDHICFTAFSQLALQDASVLVDVDTQYNQLIHRSQDAQVEAQLKNAQAALLARFNAALQTVTQQIQALPMNARQAPQEIADFYSLAIEYANTITQDMALIRGVGGGFNATPPAPATPAAPAYAAPVTPVTPVAPVFESPAPTAPPATPTTTTDTDFGGFGSF